MKWEDLQKSAAKEREVVLIGPQRKPRAPFSLLQYAEAEGVEFRIGTFKGGTESERDLRPVKWRMPEGSRDCRVDFEGRTWQCWMGAPPPPAGPDRPPRDVPDGVTEGPPPGNPPPGAPPPGGPGPGGGEGPGADAPPQGDPPGRAPENPPPGTPPPEPGGPGKRPEDPPGPGNPPPPEGDPPGTPPPPPPDPPPGPPKGGGDAPPKPEPPGKGPRDVPEETVTGDSIQETQEELGNAGPASEPQIQLPLMGTGDALVGLGPFVSFVPAFEWSLSGSFSVDGVLNNGTLCCIEGEIGEVSFEESHGWGVSLDLGSIELGLTGFSNIQGKASSQVENCIDGLTSFNEVATIDVTAEWLVQLLARGGVLSYRLGPLELESGLLASIFGTQIEVGSGRSASAAFTIDKHTTSFGAAIGAFVSVSASIGTVQIKTVVDGLIRGWGKDSQFENVPLVSAGIALGF